MILDFEPGDKVVNPTNKEWGIGQVQSGKPQYRCRDCQSLGLWQLLDGTIRSLRVIAP